MRYADKLLELFEVSSQLKYIINNNDHELPEEMVSRIIIRLGLSDKLIKSAYSEDLDTIYKKKEIILSLNLNG